jgi:hypothetical protein
VREVFALASKGEVKERVSLFLFFLYLFVCGLWWDKQAG